jgi:hypothetical protein
MSARRSFGLPTVCIVVLVWLTGCVTTLAPTRALISAGSAHASEIAVAVQANGVKHYAWTECSGSDTTCQLVYDRVLFGSTIYRYVFTVVTGAQIRHPDVAVTTDGRAFVVRSVCIPGACTDYYSEIPADVDDTTPIMPIQLASPGANSAGPPKIKARGNVVYALYLVPDGTNARLRYRQISGGTSGGSVDFRASVHNSHPSFAITSAGKFHAVWMTNTSSSTEISYSNNIGTTGDTGMPISYDVAGNYHFDRPDIALDTSDTPYIVYSYDGSSSDIVKIRCEAAASACFNGITTRVVPLDAAQNPWRLRGSPHIEVPGSAPTIVFSADTSATSNNEIWYYTPPSSGTDFGPSRITTNDVQDDEPLIVEETSNFGNIAVVAWRTYIAVTIPPNPPFPGGSFDCPRDVYTFYFNNSTLRRVFDSTGGCFASSHDLAANGQWVAGAWIDLLSTSDSRYVAWTTFNAHTSYVPITTR